ncbi:divergent PAP2 family protein [bacterium]|nr:divergent PAP2 family protein [bacterium]
MAAAAAWPVWVVVLACGVATQTAKLVIYSATNRGPALSAVGQAHGLPSLPAALLACLVVRTGAATGWNSPASGFVLVFAVIVIHDTVKLRTATTRQREVLHRLVAALPDAGPVHQVVARYLDPRAHHPGHVVIGVVFGALFALAFGFGPG